MKMSEFSKPIMLGPDRNAGLAGLDIALPVDAGDSVYEYSTRSYAGGDKVASDKVAGEAIDPAPVDEGAKRIITRPHGKRATLLLTDAEADTLQQWANAAGFQHSGTYLHDLVFGYVPGAGRPEGLRPPLRNRSWRSGGPRRKYTPRPKS